MYNTKWSKQELELLEKYKEELSNVELHKKYFPHRSVSSIQSKISKTGRQRQSNVLVKSKKKCKDKKTKRNVKSLSNNKKSIDLYDIISVGIYLWNIKGLFNKSDIIVELRDLNYDVDHDKVNEFLDQLTTLYSEINLNFYQDVGGYKCEIKGHL